MPPGLSQLLTRLRAIPAHWWQRLGLTLLVLWFTYSLAKLVWLLVAQPATFVAQGQSVNLPLLSSEAPAQALDIEAFASLNPFGKAADEPVEEIQAPSIEDEAQETRLQLQLQGVIATGDSSQDKAIIANGSQQALYSVGDALPGGANVKLSKVLSDRVVIANNGRYELLWLYDETERAKPQPVSPPKPMRATAKISRDVAERYVDMKDLSAQSLADVVKISLKRDGAEILGFEVRPGRDRGVFDAMGLQSGDIVTAVNGTSLTDTATAVNVAKSLRDSRSAQLTILRGGEETQLRISLE
ncbi:type II secretion system protein GspC [Simiduia sp. 21SJ11W-1]|uniref:type II secretion system protein GspC n=1 Tax=Simiduia sp. 21SJ11W-1 TaxID=2909669 RepID=UPI0020A08E22|nr:type II secretion system protein GspC [Simiduia sp. 21SJ11W-1]UTA47887.1 type II secretion system protein GspC [Simiduia sp. 21SJ11W-1]